MDRSEQIFEIIKTVSKKKTMPGPDESLFDSGYLDSFALPDMVSELEKKFRIRVPDSDLNPQQFDTIQKIDQYVGRASARKS
jgi:acyl carrier protein